MGLLTGCCQETQSLVMSASGARSTGCESGQGCACWFRAPLYIAPMASSLGCSEKMTCPSWRAECEPQGEQTAFIQGSKLDFHCCIELPIARPAGTSQQVKGSSEIPWRDLTYVSVGWGSVGFADDFHRAPAQTWCGWFLELHRSAAEWRLL